MLTLDQVKEKIQAGLPGSKVEILDPRKDGKHLKAIVTFAGFQGKSLLEQHRMVNNTLKDNFKDDSLHFLSIETKVE